MERIGNERTATDDATRAITPKTEPHCPLAHASAHEVTEAARAVIRSCVIRCVHHTPLPDLETWNRKSISGATLSMYTYRRRQQTHRHRRRVPTTRDLPHRHVRARTLLRIHHAGDDEDGGAREIRANAGSEHSGRSAADIASAYV